MTELLEFEQTIRKEEIIKVIGVGGGGGNAVNYMYEQGILNVDFAICNTDIQALDDSKIPIKVQLGTSLTEGLGAGSKPDRGREAAIESLAEIEEILTPRTKMVFITAGMGGGTGTGAAPVIAEKAQERGILTVGIVTIPFEFEGPKRIKQAIEGLEKMQEHVDALLVIKNDRLEQIYGDLVISNAFAKADSVLTVAAKGIAEIITKRGHVNVDFADVDTVMRSSGVALMGSGTGTGEDRALEAIKDALLSPLLNNNDIKGAKDILINITSHPSKEATMSDIKGIQNYVNQLAGDDVSVIMGLGFEENLDEEIHVTIIATGFSTSSLTLSNKKTARAVHTIGSQSPSNPQVIETSKPKTLIFDISKEEEQKRKVIDIFYGDNKDKSLNKNDLQDIPFGMKRDLKMEDYDNSALMSAIENIPAYKRKQKDN